jgi:hypothetical protein
LDATAKPAMTKKQSEAATAKSSLTALTKSAYLVDKYVSEERARSPGVPESVILTDLGGKGFVNFYELSGESQFQE